MWSQEKTANLLIPAGGPRLELGAQVDRGSKHTEPCQERQPPIDPDSSTGESGRLLGVNSRPMFTTHDRLGVYHQHECGGLSGTSWDRFRG